MNKNILLPAFMILLAGSFFTACQSSVSKIEEAKENVRKANNSSAYAQMQLNKAIQDTLANYEKCRQQNQAEISLNEKEIAEFKTQRVSQKIKNLARYQEKLTALEQKNAELKKKLE